MKQGELFSVQFYEDIPWVLAAGGAKGELAIWDTEEDKEIKNYFMPFLDKNAKKLKRKADKGISKEEEVISEGEVIEADGNDSSFEDVDSDDEKKPKVNKKKK